MQKAGGGTVSLLWLNELLITLFNFKQNLATADCILQHSTLHNNLFFFFIAIIIFNCFHNRWEPKSISINCTALVKGLP